MKPPVYIEIDKRGNKLHYSDRSMKILHREDGAAVEWADGTKEWYVNGARVTKKEHRRLTSGKWVVYDNFPENVDSAYTLHPEHIGQNESGWVITGEIHEDYYTWVNEFSAKHPVYGVVFGNFENKVFASSEQGFKHFFKHHAPVSWCYEDI